MANLYIWGERRVISQSEVRVENNRGEPWEWKDVEVKGEKILLNRELGTDVWYDELGNEVYFTSKKRKVIKTYSKYD